MISHDERDKLITGRTYG